MSFFHRHRLLKYSPDQPREPAGSPLGGQFSKGGGGGPDRFGEEAGGGTPESTGGPVSHDTVPKFMTKFIEDFAVTQDKEKAGRHSAADLVDALAKAHPQELQDLIDNLDPNHRPTIMLHKGDERRGIPTVWLLGWSKDKGTDIHDHRESEVGIHVLRGVIREKVYSGAKTSVHPRHAAFLAKDKGIPATEHERDLRAGSSIGLKAPYIHEVFGTGSNDKKDVTIHGYYPPLDRMTYYTYDQKRGRLVYDGEWDEEKPPSELDKQKKRKQERCCG